MNFPTMCFNDIVRDAQTQTHALHDAPSLAAPEKWLEYFLLFDFRYARAAVGNLHRQSPVFNLHRFGYTSSTGCELDRIAEQVTQGLRHAVSIHGNRG
jgi:hypothetical protein